ncbi:MAG: succinate dehydrogenase/fumarate reductase iron-sulfur subunit [Bdellovibrionales bacterium]|nr:succinate dehydrogenase/fumarate reductase iron-sulfur subunit [Bdellovibrionales bacterium]
MIVRLKIWRQDSPKDAGRFEEYTMDNVLIDMSFLEMLDELNEKLLKEGKRPVEFESDCREGICGTCSLMISGQAHGPIRGATTCQLYMRSFKSGELITIEPWRARAFPVLRDLVTDRRAFDRIQMAGGYTGAKTGPHADANAMLVPKDLSDRAMDAAACIGCGACVAACPNASASLFTSAKITQLALLPQGHPDRKRRALRMVAQMDKEGFGSCSNLQECEAACPKRISIQNIAIMKQEYLKAAISADYREGLGDADA